MKPLLKVIKPKSGLASSFPHTVLYGPVEQHGMGLMDPFYHQELLHLQACLEELNKASFLNELLTTSFEELRLEMGFPGRITDAPADAMADAVTKCYTKTVWRFAFQHGFSIEDPWTKLTYAREKDQFLMRAFVQQGYTGARLYRLGVVRKYLRVTTVADISTADGKKLLDSAWDGSQIPQTWHKIEWPRQPPHLSNEFWTLWQEALSVCFLVPGANDKRLAEPLGRWTVDPLPNWNWLYHPASQIL